MKKLHFTVVGDPVGKQRPRHTKTGHTYTPNKTREYEGHIANSYRAQCGLYEFPESSPIRVAVTAYYRIPKSTAKMRRRAMVAGNILPAKKPDVDNVLKSVLDALQGIAYRDDKSVTDASIRKLYSEEPRLEIYLTEDLL